MDLMKVFLQVFWILNCVNTCRDRKLRRLCRKLETTVVLPERIYLNSFIY